MELDYVKRVRNFNTMALCGIVPGAFRGPKALYVSPLNAWHLAHSGLGVKEHHKQRIT